MSTPSNFESLEALSKISDMDALVDLGIALNQLRVRGGVLNSFEQLPQAIISAKDTMELKESEFRVFLEQMLSLLEQFSQRAKGDSEDLIKLLPASIQQTTKKLFSRLLKAGTFSNDFGVKSYDWWIERELQSSTGTAAEESIVRLNIKANTKDSSDSLRLRMDAGQFNKFHESLSKLREMTLSLLG